VKSKRERKWKEGWARATYKCHPEGGKVHTAQNPSTETHPKPSGIFKYYFCETKIPKCGP
jgi:hypothetical protein